MANETTTFRTTAAERAEFIKQAAAKKISVSTYIRQQLGLTDIPRNKNLFNPSTNLGKECHTYYGY